MSQPTRKLDLTRLEVHGLAAIRGAFFGAKERAEKAQAELRGIEAEFRRAVGDRMPETMGMDQIEIRDDGAYVPAEDPK